MEQLKFKTEEAWLAARKTKITGTRVGEVVSVSGVTKDMITKELEVLKIPFDKKSSKEELDSLLPFEMRLKIETTLPKKIAYYKLIAERISLPRNPDEAAMDRGHRLEEEGVHEFEKVADKKFDTSLVMWTHSDYPSMAVSPDGFVAGEVITDAVEMKCLADEKHVQAYMTQEIPDDYYEQKLQYFIINQNLERLWFGFYNPNLICKQFFYILVTREEVEKEALEYFERQKLVIEEINNIVNEWTF